MKGGKKVDEGNKKARLRRAQRMALANGAQGEAATVTYQDYPQPTVQQTGLSNLPAGGSPALKDPSPDTDSSTPAAGPVHQDWTTEAF